MGAYLIRRLLWIPITVILISIVVFLLVRFLPGSTVDLIIAEQQGMAGSAQISRSSIEHTLGLDVPVYIQYSRWISNIVVHGSFGKSLQNSTDVTQEILSSLPVTLELCILGLIIGVMFAIPIGVYSAIRQDTILDYTIRSIAIILISIPSFWLGTVIMIYPSIWWGWSPPMELISFTKNPIGNLGMFIIPALVLGASLTGGLVRMVRTMMLEVLRQDYIRTAWAKGLNERVIIIRHTLKGALIPVITIIGLLLPSIIGGSVIIEQIFVLPGVGRLLLKALLQRDYAVVSGVNLFIAVFVVVINFFVDFSYGWLDPRIRHQ